MQEIVQEQRKAVPGRSILLEMPVLEEVPVMADPDRIGQVLGLYISQTIIERHSGRVGVQSFPGKGSTFWFTLPIVQQDTGD